MAQESSSEVDGQESDPTRQTEPAGLPESPPVEPKAKPTPKTETKAKGRDFYDADSSSKLQGTITLDVDPTTGLIAVDTCPVIRTKTFIIGLEPRKYCGPEYHKKVTPSPANAVRARALNP
jgi:hypothetical protein